MPTLKDILLDGSRRGQVVEDCAHLLDNEVASKSGLTGMAVKGAYAVVKKIKPGFIQEVVDRLLDPFVEKLDPFYAACGADGRSAIEPYFMSRSSDIADALLSVTDERAERATNRTIRKAYDSLRPAGKKHVEAAVPGIARVISKHA